MAVALTDEERASLERVLGSRGTIAQDPFGIARTLCDLVNRFGGANPAFPTDIHALLIRAREQREAFGPAAVVVDALVRERGLFPYLTDVPLDLRDRLACEMHRPEGIDDKVFHREQADVYHRLLGGENLALSAPTSFGKSLIVDAVIAEGSHDRVAVVVPTLALVDETRRRLFARFGDRYKVVTHAGQVPAGRTLYVLTPERVPEAQGIGGVTFFVIDEFYKLDPRLEPERSEAVNEALYRLRAGGAQFYLLGPNIDGVPAAFTAAYDCRFVPTDFATVATDVRRVDVEPAGREAALIEIVRERAGDGEPTLVYCGSPERARAVARALAAALDRPDRPRLAPAVAWAGAEYDPEWSFVRALAKGVGLHHARMPRALQQLVVREFDRGEVDVLVCTSTLIEGVNTTAKNVVVYDHRIGGRGLDYFTYHNIRGRSGRMGRHFVGRVYLFRDPPVPEPLAVDVPVATQAASASDALLIQLDYADLSEDARARVRRFSEQTVLPLPVLRANHGVDPDAQIRLAEHLAATAPTLWPLLSWTTPVPAVEQVAAVCDLLWEYLIPPGRRPRGTQSAAQLALFVSRFAALRAFKPMIEAERENLRARRPDLDLGRLADRAVEGTLDFLRNWAAYHFPRYLMALSRIQDVVFGDVDLPAGDYSAFVRDLENYFLPAGVAALDEYGIPLQVGRKLMGTLGGATNLDATLDALRRLDLNAVDLTPFERSLVENTRQYI